MRTPELEPPLTLVCSDRHVQMEGYPIEQGAEIEISLLPPGSRGMCYEVESGQSSPVQQQVKSQGCHSQPLGHRADAPGRTDQAEQIRR